MSPGCPPHLPFPFFFHLSRHLPVPLICHSLSPFQIVLSFISRHSKSFLMSELLFCSLLIPAGTDAAFSVYTHIYTNAASGKAWKNAPPRLFSFCRTDCPLCQNNDSALPGERDCIYSSSERGMQMSRPGFGLSLCLEDNLMLAKKTSSQTGRWEEEEMIQQHKINF